MRLRDLRDVYAGHEIYIVGSGPTTNVFPADFFKDKICLSLNDSFKIHNTIAPVALMHHVTYSRAGNTEAAPFHENFLNIKYPVVKSSGRDRVDTVDWDHPVFYFYDWSHNISHIYETTKSTDTLYYTPDGSALHAALQLSWIMGAGTIYTVGCDSTTLGGKHYANYDKNKFRDDEILKRGVQRDYDSYTKGSLIVIDFLRRKGINVFNLSPIIGYNLVDYQYDVLRGEIKIAELLSEFSAKAGEFPK
jgi:hypothetical protein